MEPAVDLGGNLVHLRHALLGELLALGRDLNGLAGLVFSLSDDEVNEAHLAQLLETVADDLAVSLVAVRRDGAIPLVGTKDGSQSADSDAGVLDVDSAGDGCSADKEPVGIIRSQLLV